MSFDLAVWPSETERRVSDPTEVYLALCNDCYYEVAAPALAPFYADLIGRYPEIDEVSEEEVDVCPWSVQITRTKDGIVMNIIWSRADEIYKFVYSLAQKHNLTMYDPQSARVVWPKRPSTRKWYEFWKSD